MIDLTMPWTEEMLVFPGHPNFSPEALERFADSGKRLHHFAASAHQGTHVDAPAHFIEDGRTIDEVDLELLSGPTHVVDLHGHGGGAITRADLEAAMPSDGGIDRLLIATGAVDEGYSNEEFFEQASHISLEAADWLVERGVQMIANDCLTEAVPGDPDRPVHRTLLGADIPIVEYIRNTAAIADRETVDFRCLPLLIPGFEAAPARAVVVD